MSHHPTARKGFTLVELLVVITIIAVLAGLITVMVGRAMERAQASKSISNMRQIGSLLATYTVDNNQRLPAPRADVATSSGSWDQLHWFEAIATLVYPSTDSSLWRKKDFWKNNKSIVLNPLINEKSKPNPADWWNVGYAFNRQIIQNLAPSGIGTNWAPGKGGPQTYAIPLASISDPANTPIIAPRADWHYTYTSAEIREPGLKEFLVLDKMPILFIDGHIESMKLTEYVSRNLDKMPR